VPRGAEPFLRQPLQQAQFRQATLDISREVLSRFLGVTSNGSPSAPSRWMRHVLTWWIATNFTLFFVSNNPSPDRRTDQTASRGPAFTGGPLCVGESSNPKFPPPNFGSSRRNGFFTLASVKYWEIIADNLSRAGWSWGMTTVFHEGKKLISVDAFREGSGRYVVQSDDILTAFLELDAQRKGVQNKPDKISR
jgi:hypothetical protein